MKLGEAKRRLNQIERHLREHSFILGKGPRDGVVPALKECNSLLQEKATLERAISETEAVTELEGNSLLSVQDAYQAVLRRIEFISILVNRDDLDESLRNSLFEQLSVFKESRDSLEKGIEVCLWETELLVE